MTTPFVSSPLLVLGAAGGVVPPIKYGRHYLSMQLSPWNTTVLGSVEVSNEPRSWFARSTWPVRRQVWVAADTTIVGIAPVVLRRHGLTCGGTAERAGAQRRITGELPVAHERCDSPGRGGSSMTLSRSKPGLIDALDRHPRVTGIRCSVKES